MNIASKLKTKVSIIVIVLLGILGVFIYQQNRENKFAQAQNDKFTEAVKTVNSKHILAVRTALIMQDQKSEFYKLTDEMMTNENPPGQRLVAAQKAVAIEDSIKSENDKYYTLVWYEFVEPMNTLYEVSAGITNDGFRKDAVEFADFSKNFIELQKELYTANNRLWNLNIALAKGVIRQNGDNRVSFDMLPVKNNDEMMNTFKNMGDRLNEAQKTLQEFQNKYAVLKGKYLLDDLRFDNDQWFTKISYVNLIK